MIHDEIRKRHFEHLNDYRQSAEYATYTGKPQDGLPSLIGHRWEIDAETYMEFLEVLPPLAYRGRSFYMSEFTFGDITAKYTKEGDKYYCEFARWPERKQEQSVEAARKELAEAENRLDHHTITERDIIRRNQAERRLRELENSPMTDYPKSTPWGTPDFVKEIAPGIVHYSTPSHGGFWLSDARIATMPKPLRDFVPFGGPQPGPGRFYEEDCDWSIVALAFPQFFTEDHQQAALETIKHYKPKLYEQLITAGIGQARRP